MGQLASSIQIQGRKHVNKYTDEELKHMSGVVLDSAGTHEYRLFMTMIGMVTGWDQDKIVKWMEEKAGR